MEKVALRLDLTVVDSSKGQRPIDLGVLGPPYNKSKPTGATP